MGVRCSGVRQVSALLFAAVLAGVTCQNLPAARQKVAEEYRRGKDLMWCCLTSEEMDKCKAFAQAAERDQTRSDYTFGSYYRQIRCKKYQSKDECLRLIDDASEVRNPNIMTVDAGDVFVGGRYHSLVPILKEVYSNRSPSPSVGGIVDYYHSLAVVKKGSMTNVEFMSDLRGVKACFPGVGSLAGWTMPIQRLIEEGVMHVVDCNNHVKSAAEFFGPSCAVNALQDRYNPLGDNSHHLCELCGTLEPGAQCTSRDPFAGEQGALRCLMERGEVAFISEKAVAESTFSEDDFELLCPVKSDASGYEEATFLLRRPLSAFEECSWGSSPGRAVVVSSAVDMDERLAIQDYLTKAAELYGGEESRRESNQTSPTTFGSGTVVGDDAFGNRGGGENPFSPFGQPGGFRSGTTTTASTTTARSFEEAVEEDQEFRIFESSPRYGMVQSLMFSDSAKGFRNIKPDDMSYKRFLGKTYGASLDTPMKAIEGVRKCPVGDMTLCVTSEAELSKCVRMRTALNAQLLEPKMSCKRASSHLECMRQVREGHADVVMLDAGDVYRAGWSYGLIPIMAEMYNLATPHYYAVAVTMQRDNSSELIYLKKKNTCHTGVGQAAGWVIPMAWLIANERVRDYGCDSVRAAAEYFGKACAPGVQLAQFQNRYEDNYWEYSHLCDLCHGQAGSYCQRNHMEDYYGHTGAFRCLVEGGGNVAFVKHTTVTENCDGKRKEWWARNQLTSDFELLCRDGTRRPARDYKNCFLGKVNSNALVTRPQAEERIRAFVNLFKYAQQFYGQKVPDEFSFSMFYSPEPYADLIFQDATQQLVVLPREKRDYTRYLDRDFLKAYEIVDCRSDTNVQLQPRTGLLTLSIVALLMISFSSAKCA